MRNAPILKSRKRIDYGGESVSFNYMNVPTIKVCLEIIIVLFGTINYYSYICI